MSPSDSGALFQGLLEKKWPDLTPIQVQKLVQFRELVLKGNETQNLTRIVEPIPFIEDHLLDVVEWFKTDLNPGKYVDLGSGAGIPGIVGGILRPDPWVLTESEGKKANFLAATTEELGLTNVQVFPGRAEVFLKTAPFNDYTVVSRAVGSVSKIFGWISGCSTWNMLVLFKGPKWDEEWMEFQKDPARKRGKTTLKLMSIHKYEVGELVRQRKIIHLQNVPRGTE
ncbi:MAG: 16S rRNA (guanine(527)-N(7))-methyltransferase RsmG [Bacteriovoracia bacterium]